MRSTLDIFLNLKKLKIDAPYTPPRVKHQRFCRWLNNQQECSTHYGDMKNRAQLIKKLLTYHYPHGYTPWKTNHVSIISYYTLSMRFSDIIFPAESRSFPGKRWGNVISRSLHLCGAAVYTGGLYFGVAIDLLNPWYILTAASGFFMLGADLYSNGKNLFQNRGFLIIIKLIILGIYQHLHVGGAWLMLCIIFFSSILSHGTADFRYYSIFHRKRI